MTSNKTSYTRGSGLLEPLLAKLRANKANDLIPEDLRQGRILDVGCGSYPYFLSHTAFNEKYAIDQHNPAGDVSPVRWHTLDLGVDASLPFDDGFFDIVTMLAVVEHLDPDDLIDLIRESYRVLQPGGKLILTTPAAWSDSLLRFMARINLVSAEEINEHKFSYTMPLLGWCLGRAGFSMHKVEFGYFEFFLNLWAVGER